MRIILILICISLYSCKKCGTCQFTTTTKSSPSIQGYPITVTSETSACGDDYNQMLDFKPQTTTAKSGNYTITTTTKKDWCHSTN